MKYLLCRNRVRDYEVWRRVFDSHAAGHRAAGLELEGLWQTTSDPANVFFLFRVESEEAALEFMNDPAAAEAGAESGVVEGEYHFLIPGAVVE